MPKDTTILRWRRLPLALTARAYARGRLYLFTITNTNTVLGYNISILRYGDGVILEMQTPYEPDAQHVVANWLAEKQRGAI